MTTVAFMGYREPLSSQGLNMYDVVVIGAGPVSYTHLTLPTNA